MNAVSECSKYTLLFKNRKILKHLSEDGLIRLQILFADHNVNDFQKRLIREKFRH